MVRNKFAKKKGCTDSNATNYSEEAKKDDGSCEYATPVEEETYTIPTTYTFKDTDGNSTVSFGGQQQRLDMLSEMVTYMKNCKYSRNGC